MFPWCFLFGGFNMDLLSPKTSSPTGWTSRVKGQPWGRQDGLVGLFKLKKDQEACVLFNFVRPLSVLIRNRDGGEKTSWFCWGSRGVSSTFSVSCWSEALHTVSCNMWVAHSRERLQRLMLLKASHWCYSQVQPPPTCSRVIGLFSLNEESCKETDAQKWCSTSWDIHSCISMTAWDEVTLLTYPPPLKLNKLIILWGFIPTTGNQ